MPVDTKIDDQLLQDCIELASESLEDGDGPFAAIIVANGRILARGRNRTVATGVPTDHAEMVAIRCACESASAQLLRGATLYCSCEPCPMCLTAAFYSGIREIVYAATLDDARQHGSGDSPVDAEWLNDQGKYGCVLRRGPHRNRAVDLFKAYIKRYGHL